MNVRAVGSADAYAAVQNIKNSVSKKFDLGVSLKVPKELEEKRVYMQSEAFLKDDYNQRMFDIIGELMKYRDEIGKELIIVNKSLKGRLVQAVNGYARLKSELVKDYSKNFSEDLTLTTDIENKYRLLKKTLLRTLSKHAFDKK